MYQAIFEIQSNQGAKSNIQRIVAPKGKEFPIDPDKVNLTVQALFIDQYSAWIQSNNLLFKRKTQIEPESKEVTHLMAGDIVEVTPMVSEESRSWELKLVSCESMQSDKIVPPSEKESSPPVPIKLKKAKISWQETQALIVKLEEKLGTKVICYYTAPNASIEQSHPDLFIDHMRKITELKKISLVLISNGGSSIASLRIATIIREYCQGFSVLVPSRCASAATNLALAADTIRMSPGGYLTAIDSNIAHELNPKGASGRPAWVSVDQVKRVLKFLQDEGPVKTEQGINEGAYRTLFKYLHPLALGEIDRNSSASELVAIKMMKMHPESFENEDKIRAIAKHLVQDYPLHAFPILFEEAKAIGLPVAKAEKEIADMLWDLVKLYDSTTRACTTHFRGDFYHFEQFSVAIESIGKRTTYYNLYNRRFNPITKIWQVENDDSRWVNIKPSGDSNTPFVLSTLDVPDMDILHSNKLGTVPI